VLQHGLFLDKEVTEFSSKTKILPNSALRQKKTEPNRIRSDVTLHPSAVTA
jgi:hypothetical protein